MKNMQHPIPYIWLQLRHCKNQCPLHDLYPQNTKQRITGMLEDCRQCVVGTKTFSEFSSKYWHCIAGYCRFWTCWKIWKSADMSHSGQLKLLLNIIRSHAGQRGVVLRQPKQAYLPVHWSCVIRYESWEKFVCEWRSVQLPHPDKLPCGKICMFLPDEYADALRTHHREFCGYKSTGF